MFVSGTAAVTNIELFGYKDKNYSNHSDNLLSKIILEDFNNIKTLKTSDKFD
jgi:hypothetical protein